ncbi:hypothetical protein PF004_g8257 [Phytophthora fragariae]|uniref:Uncharacterized protein n=1 Tax=Phytophthora fragariae TaxID=53985 RepID=A0A6G0P762_9STRA|nr:hypothetical protein PF004_g8257 [Phytophthora fragariae]
MSYIDAATDVAGNRQGNLAGGGDGSDIDEKKDQDEDGDLDADAAVDFEGNDMGSDLDTTHETPGITTVQSCTLMHFEHTEAGGQSGPSEHRWRDLENQRLEQARQVGVLDLSTPSPRSTDGTPLSSRYSITPTPTTPPELQDAPGLGSLGIFHQ